MYAIVSYFTIRNFNRIVFYDRLCNQIAYRLVLYLMRFRARIFYCLWVKSSLEDIMRQNTHWCDQSRCPLWILKPLHHFDTQPTSKRSFQSFFKSAVDHPITKPLLDEDSPSQGFVIASKLVLVLFT